MKSFLFFTLIWVPRIKPRFSCLYNNHLEAYLRFLLRLLRDGTLTSTHVCDAQRPTDPVPLALPQVGTDLA